MQMTELKRTQRVCDLAGMNGWCKHMKVPRTVFLRLRRSLFTHTHTHTHTHTLSLFLWLSAETPDTLVCINLLTLNHL